MKPAAFFFLLIAYLTTGTAAAGEGADQPRLPDNDRIRVAEVYALADSVQDSVWQGWSQVPFVILLVTPEHEFLFRHPRPPDDFTSLGYDALLGTAVFARENTGQYSIGFLATFPAIDGVNTVVIGQPEHTGKSSTLWAIVALHEHFHQLQYTRPWYYERVAALGLAGDDSSGMWQLNYPFPYDDDAVRAAFDSYTESLERAVAAPPEEVVARFADYRRARTALRDQLADEDYRYLCFQLWQEGIARYTEYAVASAAARDHRPLPEFAALPDFLPYATAVEQLAALQHREMETLDLTTDRRVLFYPVGAAEGLLLDRVSPDWKDRYFADPFSLERYFPDESRSPFPTPSAARWLKLDGPRVVR